MVQQAEFYQARCHGNLRIGNQGMVPQAIGYDDDRTVLRILVPTPPVQVAIEQLIDVLELL